MIYVAIVVGLTWILIHCWVVYTLVEEVKIARREENDQWAIQAERLERVIMRLSGLEPEQIRGLLPITRTDGFIFDVAKDDLETEQEELRRAERLYFGDPDTDSQ